MGSEQPKRISILVLTFILLTLLVPIWAGSHIKEADSFVEKNAYGFLGHYPYFEKQTFPIEVENHFIKGYAVVVITSLLILVLIVLLFKSQTRALQ